jgi:hypothetical protein
MAKLGQSFSPRWRWLLQGVLALALLLLPAGPALLSGDWNKVIPYVSHSAFLVLAFGVSVALLKAAPLISTLVSAVLRFLRAPVGRRSLLIVGVAPWAMVALHYVFRTESDAGQIAHAAAASGALLLLAVMMYALETVGRIRILMVVGGFICVIFAYGGVYNSVFLSSPLAFTFASSIEEGVVLQERFFDQITDLREQQRRLFLVALLQARPEIGFAAAASLRDGAAKRLSLAAGIEVEFASIPDPPGGEEFHLFMYDRGQQVGLDAWEGVMLHPDHEWVADLALADSVATFREGTGRLVAVYEQRSRKSIQAIQAALASRPEWELLDFCYFSAITLTTVGYGDIVPNSRLVRMLVMSQAIIGIAYVGFALAILRGE